MSYLSVAAPTRRCGRRSRARPSSWRSHHGGSAARALYYVDGTDGQDLGAPAVRAVAADVRHASVRRANTTLVLRDSRALATDPVNFDLNGNRFRNGSR